MNTIEYKFERYKGVDDLLGEYAFVGNSQGDETRTNSTKEYEASEGWLSYMFKDVPMTQEAIDKEVEFRKRFNIEYIKILKSHGTYREPFSVTVKMIHNPLFDLKYPVPTPIESYKMMFIDGSKINNKNI